MRFPYYNPNLVFPIALRSLFVSKKRAYNTISHYFKDITGKKYVLITNSCRTALYLAYKSIQISGEVITSPLTCKIAIDSIQESGNRPVFADINIGDLNIDAKDIEHRITKNTIAIQAIHHGGISCDMEMINFIAKKFNLFIVEDCAQSLGAKYHESFCGFYGDVACFSLIKNVYGIGGGILATNSLDIYNFSSELNNKLKKTPPHISLFRFIKNISSTYYINIFGVAINNLLFHIKGKRTRNKSILGQLYIISPLQLKVSALQLGRINKLHHKRKILGMAYYQSLIDKKHSIFKQ